MAMHELVLPEGDFRGAECSAEEDGFFSLSPLKLMHLV